MPKRGQKKSRKIAVQVNLLQNWKETKNEKTNVKTVSFKEVFYLQNLCWNFKLQKLLVKYSNKGVRLLLGSFPFFEICSSLRGNYG